MDFDLRLPIGGLFTTYGAIIGGYGLVGGPSIWAKSLGYNVDLIWGGVMLLFGSIMLLMALRAKASAGVVATVPQAQDAEVNGTLRE